RLDGGWTERRAAEIGVNKDAGAVDQRLYFRAAQIVERGADAGDDNVEVRNGFSRTQCRQFASGHSDDRRAGQLGFAEGLQDFLDGGNGAQGSGFHTCTRMAGLADRAIFPMTTAQGVRCLARIFKTLSKLCGDTQSSNPPLVCASASR